jgi:hypothetical protein
MSSWHKRLPWKLTSEARWQWLNNSRRDGREPVRQARKNPAGGPITREGREAAANPHSITSGNLLILKFVRKHLVFVSLPAEPLLQITVCAFAGEAAASVGLFSKMRLVHRCAPFVAGARWLSVTCTGHGSHGDLASLDPIADIKSRAWVYKIDQPHR